MTSASFACRNVRKSMRDYAVYFLTLTLGVSLFYAFNALESQQALLDATNLQARVFRELGGGMGGISVFVSAILGFLTVYGNRFLIRRRKKEFGVCMALGMEKGQISRIMIAETALVGAFSLAAGLAAGVALSQGMAMLTARLLNARIVRLALVFSPAAALKTAFFFGLLFLLVLIFNAAAIGRQRLIDLIYAERRNERFKPPRLLLSVALFAAAAVCLGRAYWIAFSDGASLLADIGRLGSAIALGAAGTFLFFFSLSGFFLKLIQQSKGLYLRNLNMFVLRQINSKIHTAYVSMSFVCLMLFVAIGAMSSGMGMFASINRQMQESAPFDATFSARAAKGGAGAGGAESGAGGTGSGAGGRVAVEVARAGGNGENGGASGNGEHGGAGAWGSYSGGYPGYDLMAAAAEAGADLSSFAQDCLTVRFFDAGVRLPLDVGGEPELASALVIRLSDYNAALRMQGIEPIALAEGEYAINCGAAGKALTDAVRAYALSGAADALPELGGATLSTEPGGFYTRAIEVMQHREYAAAIVVPDALAAGLPAARDALIVRYRGGAGGSGGAGESGDGAGGSDGEAGEFGDGSGETGGAGRPTGATGETDGAGESGDGSSETGGAGDIGDGAASAGGSEAPDYERMCRSALALLQPAAKAKGIDLRLETKEGIFSVRDAATTMVSYIAVYLGLIFIIAAATVLAIGQLSEASDNASRYGLLRKLGADEKMLRGALFAQTLIYFGAPLLLALAHSAVSVAAVARILLGFGGGDMAGGSLFTAVALLAVYGGYFLAACRGGMAIIGRARNAD